MRVAVIGLGSMGRRHALNILALGHEVVGVDPAGTDLPIRCEPSIAALGSLDAAVIATPAWRHLTDATPFLSLPLLVEKPLGLITDSWPLSDRLWVGYNWRFDPGVAELREWAVAHPRNWARFEYSGDLADWRPGVPPPPSPYLRSGLLLESSHEIDLALWMVRPWTIQVAVIPGPYSSCDAAVISGQSEQGIYEVHVDWMTPTGGHRAAMIGCSEGLRSWVAPPTAEQTYRAEAEAFMESVAGRVDARLATETDGLQVLEFIRTAQKVPAAFAKIMVDVVFGRPDPRAN